MIQETKSKEGFENFIRQEGINVVHFGTSWATSCGPLNELLAEIQKSTQSSVPVNVTYVDAETLTDVALAAKIKAAPTLIFYKEGKNVQQIDGFHPTEVRNAIVKHSMAFSGPAVDNSESLPTSDLNTRLKNLINMSRMTLFMKGNPAQPRCGFSRQIVQLLQQHNVDFWSFDILSDENVRQGLKKYSDWPTYPQLYLDGELLGGLDVIAEEIKDSEFLSKLPKIQ